MNPKEDKKEELKRLFYSNLTSIDLQNKLNINNQEYLELLSEVKQELGLPSSYRRVPHRYGKYVENAYFIKKYLVGDDFEILTYSPTLEDAEAKLRLFDDGSSILEIDQATDMHMMELIQEEYFTKKETGNSIMRKYQMPYHKFYELLRKVKKSKGLESNKTAKDTRYIYKYSKNGKFLVRKNLNGKPQGFGYYKTMDVAVRVRDYLETIAWNLSKWNSEKEKVVKEAENG